MGQFANECKNTKNEYEKYQMENVVSDDELGDFLLLMIKSCLD